MASIGVQLPDRQFAPEVGAKGWLAKWSAMAKLRRLLGSMRPYGWWVAAAYTCLLVLTGFNLAVPRILQRVIDDGVGRHEYQLLVRYALLIVAIYLLKGLFAFGQQFLSEYV